MLNQQQIGVIYSLKSTKKTLSLGMKLAIIGSRSFNDYSKLKSELKDYVSEVTQVISGGAKGADQLGEKWAKEMLKPVINYLPDWKAYGKGAGLVRNLQIVESCDTLIAFWDGQSKGTLYSINKAKKAGKTVKIINYAD